MSLAVQPAIAGRLVGGIIDRSPTASADARPGREGHDDHYPGPLTEAGRCVVDEQRIDYANRLAFLVQVWLAVLVGSCTGRHARNRTIVGPVDRFFDPSAVRVGADMCPRATACPEERERQQGAETDGVHFPFS